jgi:hypothetical protein
MRVFVCFMWYCNGRLFWLHYSGFQELYGDTQTHRQQDNIISLLLFFKNKEIRLKSLLNSHSL